MRWPQSITGHLLCYCYACPNARPSLINRLDRLSHSVSECSLLMWKHLWSKQAEQRMNQVDQALADAEAALVKLQQLQRKRDLERINQDLQDGEETEPAEDVPTPPVTPIKERPPVVDNFGFGPLTILRTTKLSYFANLRDPTFVVTRAGKPKWVRTGLDTYKVIGNFGDLELLERSIASFDAYTSKHGAALETKPARIVVSQTGRRWLVPLKSTDTGSSAVKVLGRTYPRSLKRSKLEPTYVPPSSTIRWSTHDTPALSQAFEGLCFRRIADNGSPESSY